MGTMDSLRAEDASKNAPRDTKTRTDQVKKSSKSSKKKPKGKANRDQKDADGTEAPDRFEANTVIRSQYHLDGEQLEVDPD